MKKNILSLVFSLFLILLFLRCKAEVGMGDWQCITPGNNTIDNYSGDGISLFLSNGKNYKKLEKLQRWYFYKGYIVGIQANSYFIANEKTLRVDSFNSKKQWIEFRIQQKIDPKLWPRWYTTQWTYYEDLGFYLFTWFFISIPLALVFATLIFVAIRFEKLRIRRPATLLVYFTIAIALIIYLFERFPQSV